MAWKEFVLVLVFLAKTRAECPVFWTKFKDNCYMYTGTPSMNWRAAEDYCVGKGGHLTSIHSAEENDFILELWRMFRDEKTWFGSAFWRRMAKPSRVPFVYIGLNDIVENGVFLWSDGTPFDYGEDNWLKGNPTSPDSDLGILENGVMAWDRRGNLGKWNDVNANSRFLVGPAICKRPFV